jgi:hypothetical protein
MNPARFWAAICMCDAQRSRRRVGSTPPVHDPIVVSEWSSYMPRPMMLRIAATVVASAVLAGGLAAGAGTASAIGSLVDGSGSVSGGSQDFGSHDTQLSPQAAVVLDGIVRFVFQDVLGFPEPGIKPGM